MYDSQLFIVRADRIRDGMRMQRPPDAKATEAAERARRIENYKQLREHGEALCVREGEDRRR